MWIDPTGSRQKVPESIYSRTSQTSLKMNNPIYSGHQLNAGVTGIKAKGPLTFGHKEGLIESSKVHRNLAKASPINLHYWPIKRPMMTTMGAFVWSEQRRCVGEFGLRSLFLSLAWIRMGSELPWSHLRSKFNKELEGPVGGFAKVVWLTNTQSGVQILSCPQLRTYS